MHWQAGEDIKKGDIVTQDPKDLKLYVVKVIKQREEDSWPQDETGV